MRKLLIINILCILPWAIYAQQADGLSMTTSAENDDYGFVQSFFSNIEMEKGISSKSQCRNGSYIYFAKVSASPVPFNDWCKIDYEFAEVIRNPYMNLYNVNGSLLQRYPLPCLKGTQTIDGANLPTGYYVVELSGEGAMPNVVRIVKY